MDDNMLTFTYYELENTVNEISSTISYRGITFLKVKEKMKDFCDWYGPIGSGTIYQVNIYKLDNGEIKIERKEVYRK